MAGAQNYSVDYSTYSALLLNNRSRRQIFSTAMCISCGGMFLQASKRNKKLGHCCVREINVSLYIQIGSIMTDGDRTPLVIPVLGSSKIAPAPTLTCDSPDQLLRRARSRRSIGGHGWWGRLYLCNGEGSLWKVQPPAESVAVKRV